MPIPDPIHPANTTWQDNTLFSQDFADRYHSQAGASEESRHVFLHGNNLPQRFHTLPAGSHFVIAETGFGSGLNFLEAAACFLQHAPADCQLYFISCELHPLTPTDLRAALAHYPQHRHLADQLLYFYPPATPGFHALPLAPRLQLLLLYGDANNWLPQLEANVDAWFLDGFSPAKNQQLWQPSLYQQLSRLSRQGATIATFTAAGHVRRGLTEAGFHINKCPGFGSKRDMLSGYYTRPAWQAFTPPHPHVAIVGAGIAGCTSAHALAKHGCRVTLLDSQGIASGASGNRAGILYTTPSAHFSVQNRFYQASYLHAIRWLRSQQWPSSQQQGRLSGIHQLPCLPRLVDKQQRAMTSGYWPQEIMHNSTSGPTGSVNFPAGGYLDPVAWCHHLIGDPSIRVINQAVVSLDGPHLTTADNTTIDANYVILANAHQAQNLIAQPLATKTVRGQITYIKATPTSQQFTQAICHQGSFIPAIEGIHCIGSSFDPDHLDTKLRPQDDEHNLNLLKHWLPNIWKTLGGTAMQHSGSRAALRCQSHDYLPLAGQSLASGIYVNIAHGSRGLTSTPLIADFLVSQIIGTPSPLDRDTRLALSPQRGIKS